MQLHAVTLTNYRRFVDETILLSGSPIALIGPNEAGKSTVLQAIRDVHSERAIPLRRRSRGSDERVSVTASYVLDDNDRSALKGIRGGDVARTFDYTKWVDDEDDGVSFAIAPRPERDLSDRHALGLSLAGWHEQQEILNLKNADGKDVSVVADAAIAVLQDSAETLTTQNLAALREYVRIMRLFSQVADAEYTEISDEYRQLLGTLENYVEEDAPIYQALSVLEERRPACLEFSDEDRTLRSSYSLPEVVTDTPQSLRNFLAMVNVDVADIERERGKDDPPALQTLLNRINRQLRETFTSSWDQSLLRVEISINGDVLHLFLSTPDDALSAIEERSDGLRSFIALQSFVHAHEAVIPPILTIDEAEAHLHYDAQANLIDMLTEQTAASKVVYSTHSFASLPPDLGTGIRVVRPVSGKEQSQVLPSIWSDASPGFRPLLTGLGATSFAFLPSRHVLFGEGPVDAMLLPTMFREALGTDHLSFQVAPGISIINRDRLGDLLDEGGRVAFITDGDGEGRGFHDQLVAAGVKEDVIFSLADLGLGAMILEDLVQKDAYRLAVIEELSSKHPDLAFSGLPQPDDLGRIAQYRKWCSRHNLPKPNNKRDVAQRILNRRISDPLAVVLDARYRERMALLAEKIEDSFQR
ncbi:MAG: AAA family ATPase [Thermomicrobiales bacterium]|nr:AAA family ATPase [Thermomicrobiales bacterium]